MASERLREQLLELRGSEARLAEEAQGAVRRRSQLELELSLARPALEELQGRCRQLERRLSCRVKELAAEAERVSRLRAKAEPLEPPFEPLVEGCSKNKALW